jgi:hypothetical protein
MNFLLRTLTAKKLIKYIKKMIKQKDFGNLYVVIYDKTNNETFNPSSVYIEGDTIKIVFE